jgi:hypothetical protein
MDYLADQTRNLKRKIHKSREVTVTGPRGPPVYAIGRDYLDGYSTRLDEEEEVDAIGMWIWIGQRRDVIPSRTFWRLRFVWAVL